MAEQTLASRDIRRLPARTLVQILALVLVAGLLLLFAWGLRLSAAAGPTVGQPPPDFTLTTFDGQRVSLAELRGKPVVINFWASWCKPCEEEQPALEKVWREYRDKGVVFVGVDYLDTEPDARAYLKRFNVSYPNGPDKGTRIGRSYRIRGVPETFFVGRDGAVAPVVFASTTAPKYARPITEAALREVLDRLLAAGAGP
jgi:cytochrome c biogenesis protein CcmG/thiol:disulfide interchange protein DsbE